ncbi:hypothetical protein BGZ75_007477 [Mortierella antarctica]|nr:hypothetical protein BGZ75_007477 [Mortierella antarctica]
MSTAKTGLTVPFIPADTSSSAPSKANRPRKQRNNSNHQPKKLEKSPSFNSNLSNGLNSPNTATAAAPSSGDQRSSKSGGRQDSQTAAAASENDSETGSASTTPAMERSRGYMSKRASAGRRLDQDSNRRDSSNASGEVASRPAVPAGRLFDPKKDPVPVVPSSSKPQQTHARLSTDSRSRQGSSRQQQQQQQQQHSRLYDPNQKHPQPQSSHTDVIAATPGTLSPPGSASSRKQGPAAGATTPSPMDGLARLTKEIQQLEKKVMEKPGRRTLDSDDDTETGDRHGGHLSWNRRIDNSKRLANKYLKLLQLDFKSSLKHDIDTRCWKLAIYPLIETFRAALRNSEHTSTFSSDGLSLSESDEDHADSIRHYFTEFIGFAQEFYATLKATLQKLEAKYATANGELPSSGRAVQPPRWHRCVGILGDLARYRWLHKLEENQGTPNTDWLIVARRLYREAIDLGPGNGKMYNQLALLSGCRGLESLYYYSKSLTVKVSFMNARETLMSFFAANEQIRSLQGLSVKQNSKARHAAAVNATLNDCEGSFLLLHAMLFEKINLDNFEKRYKHFGKQLRALHQHNHLQTTEADQDQDHQEHQDSSVTKKQLERWDGFYFMLAVINIAAVYEFNWSGSVIAKSNMAFGPLPDHLASVATLPYSSKMLLSTMEQTMQRYLISVADVQKKVASSSLEEQQGWLVYVHAVLVWMASKPFGSGDNMMANWLMMANHETLPTFWTTLTTFMNHHWNGMTPFEQSDMLSALSEEMSDRAASESGEQEGPTAAKTLFKLSLPPLGHEWELRGLAWFPYGRFGSQMFRGSQPALNDAEMKGDSLWKQDSLKSEHLCKRLVELSLIAALDLEVIEFDFCENAFKVNEEYAAQAEVMAAASNSQHHPSSILQPLSAEEYSTDDNLMSSSHATLSQDSGLEEDETVLFSSDGLELLDGHYTTSEILELKSKRDQLKSLLSESNANGRKTVSLGSLQRDYRTRPPSSSSTNASGGAGGSGGTPGRKPRGGRGYMDRRYQGTNDQQRSSHRVVAVEENSTLVIDTNCLVADWTLIQRLVSADRWTVIIPLAVITELDGLKNNPAPLGPAAASALTYLEGCLAMRPRLRRLKIQTSRGNYMNDLSFRVESFNYDKQQSYQQQQQHTHRRTTSNGGGLESEEDYDGDEEIMRNHNVDDFILGLCLWHQENGQASLVQKPTPQGIYLVTDDRNLRVKARARSVDVLGKDDLMRMTTAGYSSSSSMTFH